jgi:hypothetical protein
MVHIALQCSGGLFHHGNHKEIGAEEVSGKEELYNQGRGEEDGGEESSSEEEPGKAHSRQEERFKEEHGQEECWEEERCEEERGQNVDGPQGRFQASGQKGSRQKEQRAQVQSAGRRRCA